MSARMTSRLARTLATTAALGAAACSGTTTTADFTGLQVFAYFDGALPLDTLWVSGALEGGGEAFPAGKLPVASLASPPARRRASAVLVLGPELAGRTARVRVDGKARDAVLSSGYDDVVFQLGEAVTASVSLGAPSTCGDGRLSDAEPCDDANQRDGDGCSEDCTVERGYVCALAPSRCVDGAEAVYADPGAPCPGDGSAARPFCRLGAAISAPRTTTVIARRGLYRETLTLDRIRLSILGEAGAVLESDQSPALRVGGGSIVRVLGLGVRGGASGGGGVAVEGAGTQAELEAMIIGPSAAVGVRVSTDATLALRRARVIGNAGGGVELDTAGDYALENDVVAENGAAGSAFGGLAVRASNARSTLLNLTVVGNRSGADDLGGAGIACAVPAAVANTIVWGNEGAPPVTATTCRTSYSDLGPFSVPPDALGTNFSEDPRLTGDAHLDPTSPCVDRGDPSGVQPAGVAPAVDLDGEARPTGDGVDVGADEARAP